MNVKKISVILPAKNEAGTIKGVIKRILSAVPTAEVLVIDDGSTDGTGGLAKEAGAKVHRHVYSKGNGAAIKHGARVAQGDVLVFLDSDGQHDPEDIPKMLAMFDSGYDLVVGARDNASQASLARMLANKFYNLLSSWVVGHEIRDLTSGYRVVDAKKFREFIALLPNGFSYPTTSTMAFFRAGYSVGYFSIVAAEREGKGHINLFRDGVRFLLIIFKIGTLYSPMKIFFPVSVLFFLLGLVNYIDTYYTLHRFTNMSAMFFLGSIIIFLIGLVSEQVTMLLFTKLSDE